MDVPYVSAEEYARKSDIEKEFLHVLRPDVFPPLGVAYVPPRLEAVPVVIVADVADPNQNPEDTSNPPPPADVNIAAEAIAEQMPPSDFAAEEEPPPLFLRLNFEDLPPQEPSDNVIAPSPPSQSLVEQAVPNPTAEPMNDNQAVEAISEATAELNIRQQPSPAAEVNNCAVPFSRLQNFEELEASDNVSAPPRSIINIEEYHAVPPPPSLLMDVDIPDATDQEDDHVEDAIPEAPAVQPNIPPPAVRNPSANWTTSSSSLASQSPSMAGALAEAVAIEEVDDEVQLVGDDHRHDDEDIELVGEFEAEIQFVDAIINRPRPRPRCTQCGHKRRCFPPGARGHGHGDRGDHVH